MCEEQSSDDPFCSKVKFAFQFHFLSVSHHFFAWKLLGVRAGPWRWSGQCVPFPPGGWRGVGGTMAQQWEGPATGLPQWEAMGHWPGGVWPITATAATSGAEERLNPNPDQLPRQHQNIQGVDTHCSLCGVWMFSTEFTLTKLHRQHLNIKKR